MCKMRDRLVAGQGHAWFEHICLCANKRKGVFWLTSLMEVRSKQVLGFGLEIFFSFFLQLYPSTFLVQIKDLMVTLGPAVQACRKSLQFPRRGEWFFNMHFSFWHDSKTSQLLLLWKLASPSFLLFRPWFKKSLNMRWCPSVFRTTLKHVLKVLSCVVMLFCVEVLEISIYMK